MFTRLRNRFIALLMVTVTFLLVLFFSTITLLVYQSIDMRNTAMLDQGFDFHESIPNAANNGVGLFSPLFSIDTDSGGAITAVHSTFNADEEFYSRITSDALNSRRVSGRTKYGGLTLRFRVFSFAGGKRVVFLDISNDTQMVVSMVYLFFWASLPLLMMIFFMSKFFADRAIKPIRESFERQNQFMADASHEIKTPLATINANASLLYDGATPEQQKWLGYIKDETVRLEKLTSGLLYLSREPATKAERTRCDFSEITGSVLMPLEAILYEKNIDCESDIERGIMVLASEEQLRRLVGILIDNAMKYTQDKIDVTLRRSGKTAVLTVKNNGLGISAEDLTRIWDRFYRTDKARKHKGGFGLGLAMAKSIVSELGGDIRAASEPGVRTEFVVALPVVGER